MYQIFVVEDELLIRQSIRNTIEHMQGPYSFCGEASDGEMALSIMQDMMPDILVTDIRMPFLDGFGLIEHAKSFMPWLKVVIISGYGDFEFARKAITLGVDQYLLKPVRPAELTKVLEEIAAQIEKEKTSVSTADGFDEKEVHIALQKHFTQQLLYGGTDTAALLEQARLLQIDIVHSFYLVVVCQFEVQAADQSLLIHTVQKTIGETENLLHYFNAADQVTMLISGNDEHALNEKAYQYIQILKHELKEICPVITTVIGNIVRRLAQISESHKNVVLLLKRMNTAASGKVINAEDTAQITADIISSEGPVSEKFMQKLPYANVEDVPVLMNELLEGPGSEKFGSALVRYYTLMSLMKLAVRSMEMDSGREKEDIAGELSEKYDIFKASGQYDTFVEMVRILLEATLEVRKSKFENNKYAHVIARAEEYVKNNCCDPNISLISAARHVGMSSAHFSTVFSQQQGQTFISYLTAVRMEKAKKLLLSTNMKLSDVALEVGYNEPNYFSHVFRKTEGMTPKEYRNNASV